MNLIGEHKYLKVRVILTANAIIKPFTMMIILRYTFITLLAMLCPRTNMSSAYWTIELEVLVFFYLIQLPHLFQLSIHYYYGVGTINTSTFICRKPNDKCEDKFNHEYYLVSLFRFIESSLYKEILKHRQVHQCKYVFCQHQYLLPCIWSL